MKQSGALAGKRFGMVLFVAFILAACGRGGEENAPAQGDQAVSNPLSEQAQSLVDQGNTAQRDGRYDDALDLFGQAMEIHPDHPVPQFGSLMAALAVGDTVLAGSLRTKLEVTGPDLLEMLRQGGAMGSGMPGGGHVPQGGLPQGHPVVEADPVDTLRPPGGASGE